MHGQLLTRHTLRKSAIEAKPERCLRLCGEDRGELDRNALVLLIYIGGDLSLLGLELFRVQGDIVELELGRVEDDCRGLFDYIETDRSLASYRGYFHDGRSMDGRAPPLYSDLLDGGEALKGEVVEVSSDSEVVMARFHICWESEFSHLRSRVQVVWLVVERRRKTGQRSRAKPRLALAHYTETRVDVDVHACRSPRYQNVTREPC